MLHHQMEIQRKTSVSQPNIIYKKSTGLVSFELEIVFIISNLNLNN